MSREEERTHSNKKTRLSCIKVEDPVTTEGSGDEVDDNASIGTESLAGESTRSDTPTQLLRKGGRGGGGGGGGRRTKGRGSRLKYKCTNYMKEDHGQPIFGCQFNYHCKQGQPQLFATVGSNRVTIYSCEDDGKIKLMQGYADSDPEESFYTCAWTYDPETGHPLLAAGGLRGIIRILSVVAGTSVKHFLGHGQSVNELKFHPRDPTLLLSVGKDHSLRLWNIKTDLCICVLGGVDGHRDEVLSGDFNLEGTQIVSCGMDHSLKIWCLNKSQIQEAIEKSRVYNSDKEKKVFPTFHHHFPDFTTRDIHRNYVDCCRWLGKFVLSKSCENKIVCWKPGKLTDYSYTLRLPDSTTCVLHTFDFKECEIWFMRFSMDFYQKVLAQGNQSGKVFVWDLDGDDPTSSKPTILTHTKCNSPVRQTHLSKDGSVLIYVCDDATVWRWDRVKAAGA